MRCLSARVGQATPTQSPPELLDAAILFAPVGALVPAALRVVRKGGRVVCGGIHMSDIPQFPYSLLWEERQIRLSRQPDATGRGRISRDCPTRGRTDDDACVPVPTRQRRVGGPAGRPLPRGRCACAELAAGGALGQANRMRQMTIAPDQGCSISVGPRCSGK